MTVPRQLYGLLTVWLLHSELAYADLTLTGYSTVASFGMPASSQERIMIHTSSVRRDFVDRGRAYTHLFDLDKGEAVVIDHGFRQAEIYDLNTIHSSIEVNAPSSGLKLTLERTGRKQPLLKWMCMEHTLTASMPARLGNEDTVFHMTGQVWLAQGVPEQAQVKSLVRITKRPDFFLAVPSIARVMPAQAQAMSEIIRKMASRGLPCAGEVEVTYEGNGPMANLARKMPTKLGVSYQSYSTDPVSQDAFAIPEGYQAVSRKLPVVSP